MKQKKNLNVIILLFYFHSHFKFSHLYRELLPQNDHIMLIVDRSLIYYSLA